MAFITDYQYYENGGSVPSSANHGSYQYTPLKEIVENFMNNYVGRNEVIQQIPRHKVVYHAKQSIKELNYDALKEVRVAQIDVNDDISVVLPHDYVNWVRISLYDSGVLVPMYENKKINWANAYLKSNDGQLMFDNDGNVIFQDDSLLENDRKTGNDINEGISVPSNVSLSTDVNVLSIGSLMGADPSSLVAAPSFRINRAAGRIEFSSDASGRTIFLEYVTDGMENNQDTMISVNKMFEDFIYADIRYRILDNRMGAQEYLARRARKKRKALWQNARIRISSISPGKILMAMRGQDKWIK